MNEGCWNKKKKEGELVMASSLGDQHVHIFGSDRENWGNGAASKHSNLSRKGWKTRKYVVDKNRNGSVLAIINDHNDSINL